ncbi:MAG: hypothetical protein IT162_06970 [Bryobacterales bacterium]|nr:hypothetical protein [Bryobacterales bacterium]
MPPPLIDLRPDVARLRTVLEKETVRQRFIALEEFIAPLTVISKRKLIKPEEGRLWLNAMARVFAGLYVHLPFKHTRYAANPIESLKALERSLPMPPADFSRALLNIFRELRDPHTQYRLPEPYGAAAAFLPFLAGAAYAVQYDPKQIHTPLFFVTKVARALQPALAAVGFQPGARITHWNGLPMTEVVHQLALRENGANPEACFARAMDNLTLRPLSRLLVPDAATAVIRFDPPPAAQVPAGAEAVFEWSVRRTSEDDSLAHRLFDLHDLQETGWQSWEEFPIDRVAYRVLPLPHPTAQDLVPVGVIRLNSFREEVESFVNQFRSLLEHLRTVAPLALLIDLRGNRGGNIPAAEQILQLLTPGQITPASFQFLNSALLQRVAGQNPLEADRLEAFGLDTDTGAVFSRAAHLTSEDDANRLGQCYYGRVALITDALCYSAADIFAAGFQDHRIGPVIGVDGSTGGGGANAWAYDSHVAGKVTEDGWTFPDLPDGANLQFSVRQSLRTGRFQGKVLEDFGVTPDYRYLVTESDLFGCDAGLYDFAFSRLLWGTGLQEISVDLQLSRMTTYNAFDERLRIDCRTSGVGRAELLVNGKTLSVADVHADGSRWSVENYLDWSMKQLETVELRCYNVSQAELFPFVPEPERAGVRDAGKSVPRLVASRKFTRKLDEVREAPQPRFPRIYPPPEQRRRRLLYYVNGCGSQPAREALRIATELRAVCPDAEVRFVSHGAGARTLREHGLAPVDLELPDRPPLFAVQDALARKWTDLEKEFQPLMLASHGEPELVRRLGEQQEPDWPCPCVLLVQDVENAYLPLLRGHREILVLGEAKVDLAARIRPVGPILRELRCRREDMEQARQEMNLPIEELIVSVIVAPGARTELAEPAYDSLRQAFALVNPEQHSQHRGPLTGKRLLWDPAAGLKEGPFFDASDYGRVMAASDVVITKGDASVIAELHVVGTPCIVVSRSMRQPCPSLKGASKDVLMLPSGRLQPEDLNLAIADILAGSQYLLPVSAPPDGARNAAARLKELLLEIESFGEAAIMERAGLLAEGKLTVAEFRYWFDEHGAWTTREALAQEVATIVQNRQAHHDHLDANDAQKLAEAVQAHRR